MKDKDQARDKKWFGSSPVDQDSQERSYRKDELAEREEGTGRTSEGGNAERQKKMRKMEGSENKQTVADAAYDRDVAWTDDDEKIDALFDQSDMVGGRNESPILENEDVKHDPSKEDTISSSATVDKTHRMMDKKKEREQEKDK
ncbi:hypothetical protein [Indiicoccus explosivorum]|uniref:hypothetical protein n=1 Tax=Indiicoccus explosivorum TaxID=1917864 RepID=UPI000B437D9F|nr:hypothetical protein [Indiicoccus explosivorum]